ncbi:uncharacterized protein LOC134464422 [Engraulis encrasicolus]|uniref:uncharacterized protein LOC134464422 n=1 Tax=Engraulis encrasicolus TaxID=184585 RepID=UPI002FD11F0A
MQQYPTQFNYPISHNHYVKQTGNQTASSTSNQQANWHSQHAQRGGNQTTGAHFNHQASSTTKFGHQQHGVTMQNGMYAPQTGYHGNGSCGTSLRHQDSRTISSEYCNIASGYNMVSDGNKNFQRTQPATATQQITSSASSVTHYVPVQMYVVQNNPQQNLNTPSNGLQLTGQGQVNFNSTNKPSHPVQTSFQPSSSQHLAISQHQPSNSTEAKQMQQQHGTQRNNRSSKGQAVQPTHNSGMRQKMVRGTWRQKAVQASSSAMGAPQSSFPSANDQMLKGNPTLLTANETAPQTQTTTNTDSGTGLAFTLGTVREFLAFLEPREKTPERKDNTQDFARTILDLYWGGDYHNYIVTEQKGTFDKILTKATKFAAEEDKVVFYGMKTDFLNRLASVYNSTASDVTMETRKSSWRNVSDESLDIDKELADGDFMKETFPSILENMKKQHPYLGNIQPEKENKDSTDIQKITIDSSKDFVQMCNNSQDLDNVKSPQTVDADSTDAEVDTSSPCELKAEQSRTSDHPGSPGEAILSLEISVSVDEQSCLSQLMGKESSLICLKTSNKKENCTLEHQQDLHQDNRHPTDRPCPSKHQVQGDVMKDCRVVLKRVALPKLQIPTPTLSLSGIKSSSPISPSAPMKKSSTETEKRSSSTETEGGHGVKRPRQCVGKASSISQPPPSKKCKTGFSKDTTNEPTRTRHWTGSPISASRQSSRKSSVISLSPVAPASRDDVKKRKATLRLYGAQKVDAKDKIRKAKYYTDCSRDSPPVHSIFYSPKKSSARDKIMQSWEGSLVTATRGRRRDTDMSRRCC